jgi:hypothetical protein
VNMAERILNPAHEQPAPATQAHAEPAHGPAHPESEATSAHGDSAPATQAHAEPTPTATQTEPGSSAAPEKPGSPE